MSYETISPEQLAERRKSGEGPLLIDVREPHEYELARIEGAKLLPLSRFEEWADSLDPAEEIVVMCHHGIRSAQVCALLARHGYQKMRNLAGGIDRWSCEVDGRVPRY